MSLRVAGSPASTIARTFEALKPSLQSATRVIAPGATGVAVHDGFADPDAARKREVQELFQEQFGDKAKNPAEFDAFMRSVFGEGYDTAKAEEFRQKALAGDFSWLPPVRFVDAATLQGGKGAFVAEEGVVLPNRDLSTAELAKVYVEEAGHFVDSQINTADTVGDEGELFRRVLSGERLTAADIAAIRADDDHGVITVDGKQVEVEFWFGEDLWNGAKKVVSGAVDAVKDVGKGIVNAAGEVVKGVGDVVTGVIGGVGGGVVNFFGNLVKGRVGDAFDSLVKGIDKGILQTAKKVLQRAINAQKYFWDGMASLIPITPVRDFAKNVVARAADIAQTATDTVTEWVRDAYGMVTEVPVGVVKNIEKAIKLAADGEWGEAFKTLAMTPVDAVSRWYGGFADMIARGAQGIADIVGTGLFLQPPARELTDQERTLLHNVYGDSIDYSAIRIRRGGVTEAFGMAPHTVGNTIYIPEKDGNGRPYFNEDGSLTAEGQKLLIHEAAHVWQSQNTGGDYIHKSLWNQGKAAVGGGSRNGAYDWRSETGEKTRFRDLNPEQQAHFIEQYAWAARDGVIDPAEFAKPPAEGALSDEELAYANDLWSQWQAERYNNGKGLGEGWNAAMNQWQEQAAKPIFA